MTTAEPRWTEQDRGEALALALWRDTFCPCGCGNKVAQTLVHEDQGPDWVVDEVTCTARLALIEKQNAVAESRAKYASAGLWTVKPRRG